MTEAPVSTAPPSTLDRAATKSSGATAARRLQLNPRAAITCVVFFGDHRAGDLVSGASRAAPRAGRSRKHPDRHRGPVSGRLVKVPVKRGHHVAAGTTLLVIDNPELVAQLHEAEAEKLVADAELARINVGTRSEIIAQRKAEIDRAAADLTLAQQTYNRTKQLAAAKF